MKPPKIYSILPKILHRAGKPLEDQEKPVDLNPDFLRFFNTRMDFYFRKVLKYNKIAYTWDRKNRILTINTPTSPFHMYLKFDKTSNYVTVKKIPCNNYSYCINAISVEDLINKMVRYKILYPRHLQVIIVPISLKAEQMELFENWV